MVGIKDDDTCERCLHKESAGYDDAMKVNANLRNGGEEQWYQALGTPEEKS